ncbi:MAG: pyridoxamine 5'-phosphate oxidase [Deltaproteobacteria bacterium]|nr:pyridoxamine 5'-phosphate oxidase [Deltaproteobacteria bacterium]
MNKKDLLPDPFKQFRLWYDEACGHKAIELPWACCLSTISEDGFPDGRMMLLKEADDRGFVLYTNAQSPKGKSLLGNKKGALTFYWEDFRRQIRVQGEAEQVTPAEADAYFVSRPRESQIGAWVSQQSQKLESREVLDKKFGEYSKKFEGKEVSRPPYWTGFRIIPAKIEFWQERDNRLHDRFLYTRTKSGDWKIERLYP